VVIWLQGGPGSSSLYGQFELHGPYAAVYDRCGNVKAKLNPMSWITKVNMLYFDNPVGAGKSSKVTNRPNKLECFSQAGFSSLV
jgi:vitellogenic carboxypeptidase-like protein